MIEINELTFNYKGTQTFSIGPINISCLNKLLITGKNGGGKTTFMKCLARIIKPKSGSINIQSQEIFFMSSHTSTASNYLTGKEYIMLSILQRGQKINMKILNNKINELNMNEIAFLSEPTFTYSSGQIKLLKIVSGLLSPCDLLILDEPDSNLDESNCKLIYKLLNKIEIASNRSIIMSSHRLKKLNDFYTFNISEGK